MNIRFFCPPSRLWLLYSPKRQDAFQIAIYSYATFATKAAKVLHRAQNDVV